MKKILCCALLAFSGASHAALEAMDNNDLSTVEAQAGADLSWELRLNQDSSYQYNCTVLSYCHLGMSFNNRYLTGTAPNWTPSSTGGQKLWLVFKGLQGTINIQKVGLDGADLTYGTTVKPAIQLSYTADQPILIRNFGYGSLAIEYDNFNTTGGVEAGSATATDYGYLKNTTYNSTNAPGSNFDWGRETGFTGLMMNGNLAMQGTVKIFSCDSSHPRCS